jgi:dephospho-CoA kinase
MKIIGVTGKSGSGKTTIAYLLSKKYESSVSIDVDKISHNTFKHPTVIETLKTKFGNRIFDNNGEIDRKKLGELTFANEHSSKELTEILREAGEAELDEVIRSSTSKIIILDWFLLPKSKYWDM